MIAYISLALQLGAAAALVLAACAKLTDPPPIRGVVEALGIPRPEEVAGLLGFVELATGLALMLLPGSWLTAGLVAALAIAFTASAGLALRGHLEVECACFGSSLSGRLGVRQVLLAPVWAAVAVSVVAVPVALPEQRLPIAFAVVALVGIGKLVELRPLLAEHRIQRRIIEGLE